MLGSLKIEPKWDTVRQAQPVNITAPKPAKQLKTKHKVAIALPDPQIGGRFLFDTGWDPFHDEAAMDVALQLKITYCKTMYAMDGGDGKLFDKEGACFVVFEKETLTTKRDWKK